MVTFLIVGAVVLGVVALASGVRALARSRNRAFLKVRQVRLKDLPDK
jgi:hypothetical protein